MHLRSAIVAAAMAFAAVPTLADDLTLYSGRGESLVAPIIAAFEAETGIKVNVRYAGTSELAVLLQEEGAVSPADLCWAQDVGALGAVKGLMTVLPEATLAKVPAVYHDADGRWIGTSGRARVIACNTSVDPATLPKTLASLADPAFKGRFALAPTNGSFQAHVTALRVAAGDEFALNWLKRVAANEPVIVRNNTAGYQAVADGEAGFFWSNNDYLGRFLTADDKFPVAQTTFEKGDIGNLMMAAAIGVLDTSDHKSEAVAFVDFLLGAAAQQYFISNVYEFPVTTRAIVPSTVKDKMLSYETAVEFAPAFDLNTLGDLEGTLKMLTEAGLI
jgi:iron(III) transport system substrate-binding protein